MPDHDELLGASGAVQNCELARENLDSLELGPVSSFLRRPVPDPAEQDLVVQPSSFYQAPASVCDGECGLLEQEALLRVLEVDPASVGLADNGVVVSVRVISEERELEPVLASQRPVAIGVAAPVL